jgi:hypothetical protein
MWVLPRPPAWAGSQVGLKPKSIPGVGLPPRDDVLSGESRSSTTRYFGWCRRTPRPSTRTAYVATGTGMATLTPTMPAVASRVNLVGGQAVVGEDRLSPAWPGERSGRQRAAEHAGEGVNLGAQPAAGPAECVVGGFVGQILVIRSSPLCGHRSGRRPNARGRRQRSNRSTADVRADPLVRLPPPAPRRTCARRCRRPNSGDDAPDRLPGIEVVGKIAPRCPGSGPSRKPFQRQPMVIPRPPTSARQCRENGLDHSPQVIGNLIGASHLPASPINLGYGFLSRHGASRSEAAVRAPSVSNVASTTR